MSIRAKMANTVHATSVTTYSRVTGVESSPAMILRQSFRASAKLTWTGLCMEVVR
jgi:hypothetical protein